VAVAPVAVAPAFAGTVAPALPVAAPVMPVVPAGNISTGQNQTGAVDLKDYPPYLQGPSKILVYGMFFALLYLAVWYARLPPEKRPAAVDEGLMRWIESQEEDDPTGSVNCMLVRVKRAVGLPADKQPASVEVECWAFQKSVDMGETDMETNGIYDTCFVGPLLDQDQNRNVTMEAAKPEVKFIVKYQPDGAAKPTEIAQAIMKPGSGAGSSSSAAPSSGGGITRGDWCQMELKLVAAGSGAMGMMKRAGGAAMGASLGTLSVEVKAMRVNPAGKTALKSNYAVIALRNEFKKPFSAAARTLAVGVMGMLALTSLPVIGDMFQGCFYLSCHGLGAACTLFCMAIPHWCELFHIQLPGWVKAMSLSSLRTAGASLASCGSSGVYMVLIWGHGEECSNHFWILEILLCVDSLLFTYAWWKGEGGGLMGWLNG